MGLESTCTLTWQGRAARGKALLESGELLFRGEMRLRIPRSSITAVAVDGGLLRVSVGGDTASFVLGAAAEKWALALATVRSRLDKLGAAPGLVVGVIGIEDRSFLDELRERGVAFTEAVPSAAADLLFFGLRDAPDLGRIDALRLALAPAGALWLVRPKGHAELTEARVMAAGKLAGLVDVKVAAFSPTHTAEKFVIPRAARAATRRAATKPAPRAAASKKRG